MGYAPRMHSDPDCLFCKIVKGEIPAHKIWEDDAHLAFLTIFPNTEGATVVIPKEHYQSYAFDLEDAVLTRLMLAVKKVAKLLDAKLEDVGRCGMVFEGMAINHIHAKLFPMHGTKGGEWKPLASARKEYYETYPGFISSHDYERAPEEALERLAKKIRGET